MCEKTIEGSLAHVDGVVKADWDKDTKQIEIAFDSTKINLDEIKQKIAGVGYDMDGISASTSVYSALPGCCQYDRPVAK
jgi:copper chaperone CopZ